MVSKRKATTAGSAGDSDRAAKRAKAPGATSQWNETPETTTETGMRFLNHLKNATDKQGRVFSINFQRLPDRKLYPDYYEVIVLPVSLETIEEKLLRREYPTMTTVESDIKRLVSNAKAYNDKFSEIFADAERIRKATVSFMQKNNPAYNDPTYSAFPTPLPTETRASSNGVNGASKETSAAPTPAPPTPAGDLLSDFSSDSFQQAQDRIITEMIELKDDDGDEIALPFVNLPSRSLTDYYQVIKRPISLRGIQKKIKGIRGRGEVTGMTEYRTWDAFEEEVSGIWRNAREYNVEGSEIYDLAGDLENYFNMRLEEARSVVVEPPQPSLKLKMSAKSPEPGHQKLLLRMPGQAKPSPAGTPKPSRDSSTPGVHDQRPASKGRDGSTVAHQDVNALREKSTSAASPLLGSTGVKRETQGTQSPALANAQIQGLGIDDRRLSGIQPNAAGMLPPNVAPRLPSGSPYPSYGSPYAAAPPPPAQPAGVTENIWRPSGKGVADALISNLTISTHPSLNITKHLKLNVPPLPTKTQQFITLNLPPTHNYLRFTTLLNANMSNRNYKLFVTYGTQRLPSEQVLGEPRKSHVEVRLAPGVNRIEIEAVAAPLRGAPKTGPPGQDVEIEKVTVYANLLRGL